MISADTGFRLNVIGSSMAMVATGPTPGRTPISVPSRTPINAYSRLIGEIATPKPRIRLWKRSMRASAPGRRPHREGQRQALHEDKIGERHQYDEEDGDLLPLELVAAVRADEHQRGSRAHQAERLHGVAVDETGHADENQRLGIRAVQDSEHRYDERRGEHAPGRRKSDPRRELEQHREDRDRDEEIDDVEGQVQFLSRGLDRDALDE